MSDDDADDYGFSAIPLAEQALAEQGIDRLTARERDTIEAYAWSGFELINAAMRGLAPMTPVLARRIEVIRSGLRKYPLPTTVRVSRETEARLYGLVDEASAHDLVGEVFDEPAFLSTSAAANPPPAPGRHIDPVILDLIVPTGTPALRLGELAAFPLEQEVLLIDARSYVVVGVDRDPARSIWRIRAVVEQEGER
ncbi:ADP-ribosyltransferase [Nocardia sp. CDC160]|uniref:ADP-ribosyltransferase n=1 Tax=Nocardia sp. CDC160 TaxID=3112166 RepID=UPI002DB9DD5F|nr:ADP-ribosyltransferase [Nocardia sp. CDC160]MEC3920324.1 ADP-ribosyltransferase [Nocardia sp. CDC160]